VRHRTETLWSHSDTHTERHKHTEIETHMRETNTVKEWTNIIQRHTHTDRDRHTMIATHTER